MIKSEFVTERMKKMKCDFCDCNVKKDDEFCPHCGKQLIEKDKPANKSEKFGKTLRFYDYKDGLALQSVSFVLLGLVIIAADVFFIADFHNYIFHFSARTMKWLVFAAMGILLVIIGIVSFFRMKGCSVSLCENGIYGYIPDGLFKTVYFEVLYEDIENVKRSGFGTARNSLPKIIIKTSDDKFTISFPKKENTVDLSECFYRMLDM